MASFSLPPSSSTWVTPSSRGHLCFLLHCSLPPPPRPLSLPLPPRLCRASFHVRCHQSPDGAPTAEEIGKGIGGERTSVENGHGWTPTKGWLKVGGGLVLAIGFALGAQSLYDRKTTSSEFAVPLPSKEEILCDKQTLSSEEVHHQKPISVGTYNESEENKKSHMKGTIISRQTADSNGYNTFEDSSPPRTLTSNQTNERDIVEIPNNTDSPSEITITSLKSSTIDDLVPISSVSGSDTNNSLDLAEVSENHGSLLDSEKMDFISIAPTIQASVGKVVVGHPQVDHGHEQALAALQALKVIESGVEPGSICTRREYARWIIAASGALTRSPSLRVSPAMYIENFSELAFNDVLPDDPDFPFIQGLAEAGLISSKLSKHNSLFSPDSPLTRQDLVSWKIASERRGSISAVSEEDLEAKAGFIDMHKIRSDTRKALVEDIAMGDRSIVALTFGYTRRFQPEKPVTKAQAAASLISGKAAEIVQEELARMEAESIVEAVVRDELESEVKAEESAFDSALLEQEAERRVAVERETELVMAELENLRRLQWEEEHKERSLLLEEKTMIESEKELLGMLRRELEQRTQSLSTTQLELEMEKERIRKLQIQGEEVMEDLIKTRAELEVDKRALTLARISAEEEAKRAQNLAKALEEKFRRGSEERVEVVTSGKGIKGAQKSLVEDILVKSNELKGYATEALSVTYEKLQIGPSGKVLVSSIQGSRKSLETIGGQASLVALKTAENAQHTLSKYGMKLVGGLREGSKRVVDEFKGGAEKLAHKLKKT